MSDPREPAAGENGPVVLELDSTIYRDGAIKKAAYKFTERCHIKVEKAEGHFRVVLQPKSGSWSAQVIAGDYINEVLDQELRAQVSAETDGIRNLLIAHAFSKTSLLEPELETADYRDDPTIIDAQ